MTPTTRPAPGGVEERTALDAPAPTVEGRRLHGVIPTASRAATSEAFARSSTGARSPAPT